LPTTSTPWADTSPPGGTRAAYEAWLAYREAGLDAARTPVTIAATSVPMLRKATGWAEEPWAAPDEEPDSGSGNGMDADVGRDGEGGATASPRPRTRGRAATAIGRAVHASLQLVDFETREDLDLITEAQAAAELVAGQVSEVRRLVRAALDSAAVRSAIASGRYWRELYVGAPVGGRAVEGFVDLLYEMDGGLVVVDYKTDSVRSDGDIDEAMERYRLQGATYALALQTALGRPVARCVFVFLRAAGGAEERSVEDLPAAVEEVRRLVSSA
ncbi:MAG TPA: PD-(D/E)XK nuclease family protein, partial [Acidimicrobiales bacterium]|nr:PD-(D/E)XK nuclease family protein [Acidimicrobiales bacterium]